MYWATFRYCEFIFFLDCLYIQVLWRYYSFPINGELVPRGKLSYIQRLEWQSRVWQASGYPTFSIEYKVSANLKSSWLTEHYSIR